MYDFGRSFISLYGNKGVEEITAEANRRLEQYSAIDGVPCVFWGESPGASHDHLKLTGSEYVHYAFGEWGEEEQLCFKSSTTIPEKLENHLVWFYSKIDPNVLLVNEYDSELGSFVGVRYKLVEGGKIITFANHQDVISEVVYDINEESPHDQITWDDFWDIQSDLKVAAVQNLMQRYPRIAVYSKVAAVLES
jgi:hypothetical protein